MENRQQLAEDQRRRDVIIAQLRQDERWNTVVQELESQERNAFESLLNGATKDTVVATVLILRSLKGLPERAWNRINREGIKE